MPVPRQKIALLFLSAALCLAAPAPAEVLPPEEAPYTGPCMGEEAFGRTWIDRTHSYLTTMLCQPSVWFDGFFGEYRAGDDWAGSLVRWQGSVRLDEREDALLRSEFSASLRLPRMNKKLKLIINSETQDDETENLPDSGPNDLGTPSDLAGENEKQTTAGLRYYLSDTRKTRLHLGAGLKFGDPVQPYLRLRLRYSQPLGNSMLLRLTPSVIWLSEDGLNRSLRIDLEERIDENALIRVSQSYVRKEQERGTQWGTALTLFERLSPVTVMAVEAGVRGSTYPGNYAERFRTSIRFRSNFLRRWLFLEVEPEYYWPRDEEGEYHLYRAITLRVELQFYS